MSLSQAMYWVCSDVLSLILQLRSSRDLPAPDILQRRVLGLFDTMMQNGREARIPEFSRGAEARLRSLGYTNIECFVGDGSLGWPPCAPYDGILVTAGAPDVPAPLYRQLAVGELRQIRVGGFDIRAALHLN